MKPKSNIRGILSHPSKKSAIKTVVKSVPQFGQDSFAQRDDKKKAKIA